MGNVIEKIKQRWARPIEPAPDREVKRAKLEAEIEAVTERLTGKVCPIHQGTCFTKCAHFQMGMVFNDQVFGWLARMPKCKLWG